MNEITARALLGVSPSADADAIKRAYRRIARSVHPDHGGSAVAFQRLVEAQRIALGARPPASRGVRRSTPRSWIDGSVRPSHRVSMVDCARNAARAHSTEAASSSPSFGEILARAIDAA